MDIVLFTCLQNNYAVLLRDPAKGQVTLVDAPAAEPVIAELERRGWSLDQILVTHGHADHIDGLPRLIERYHPAIVGPRLVADKLPPGTRLVDEGDRVSIGAAEGQVWHVPGHCADHIAFHFANEGIIFVGDTLFTMGCGRVFGDDPSVLYRSIQRIGALPDETLIYSGHEYTLNNAQFARVTEPENQAIAARLGEIERLTQAGIPTVPTTLAEERATNVFLRARDEAEFARRREAKNRF
jgi:hydroxyacylglutathione hydrolase